MSRQTVFVALGGGVIGDLTGFAASIYLRGVRVVQLPTTLLAQVDSAIGGKVGVNHALGKNTIGAFYQPTAVISDLNVLKSLAKRDYISGLAEVLKYGFIEDLEFVHYLRANRKQILERDLSTLSAVITYCAQAKVAIVAGDEFDHNHRMILNFGHTVGHALERAGKYQQFSHGEAVSIGMVAAARISNALGMLKSGELDLLTETLDSYGLPTSLKEIDWEEIYSGLVRDKKGTDSCLTFVLPTEIGKVEVVRNVEIEVVKGAVLSLVRG